MTSYQVMNGLLTFLGCIVVVIFFYGPWQRMVADAVRQRWFEIRDEVFDAAARGELQFADPHYQQFRSSVNCLILNAEETTAWRAVALYWCARDAEPVSVLVSRSDKPVPDRIKKAEDQVLRWFAILMWLRSPFLIFATFVLIFAAPILLLFAAASASIRSAPFTAASTVRSIVVREANVQAHQHVAA